MTTVKIPCCIRVNNFKFQPLNQLVTSGNANLYSNNAIEEGLHSALGIQADNSQPV